MVQVLPANTKGWDRVMDSFSKAGQSWGDVYKNKQAKNKELEAYKQMGIDASVADLPPQAKAEYFKNYFSREDKASKFNDEISRNRKQLSAIADERGIVGDAKERFIDDFQENVSLGEKVTKPIKEKTPALTEKEVPQDISRKIKKILSDNPNATSDELRIAMDENSIPPVYSNPYTENRRRTEETLNKQKEDKRKELRHETLPLRTRIAEKAQTATKAIQNKEELLNIIEKGNLDDPTFAALAQALPLDLGKRLLSNDTIEYKAGLVEEFGDLRNIFQGQTRVKEIELLEEKIADIYLTDEQKKAILRSRINALKADQVMADVAQELENEELGILQFENELQKRAKPKMEALFNQILDEQKSIINNAENRKKIPLNINDPDDAKIAQEILIEAGGNRNKARELAKKKGYTF